MPQEEEQPAEPDNPLMRKKKTPEEMAAEAELEDADDFTSEFKFDITIKKLATSFIFYQT